MRLKSIFIALPLIGGVVFGPLSLPYLSIGNTDRYVNTVTFGAFGNIYELTGDLHGMFGWPERVAAVAELWDDFTPDERERTMLLAGGYGTAGAIDLFGAERGLPSAHRGLAP